MAGYELAKAYVSVIASTKGAGAQIISEIGSAGERAGSEAGSKASGAFGRLFGGAIGGVVTKALAGLSLGTVLGTAFSKGFNRLKAIDVAQAKLRGLGNDAESVSVIVQNASASVKGTAFGLDAAATAAAGAVAAGIQPGEQLEAVLKSVSNSAAASGSSMEEMGAIYNKVASVGKAQNDASSHRSQTEESPSTRRSAKQLGVTADEVFKMASDGKIGFDQFEKAMTSAAGNVAFEMGNTLPGAFANAQAALGRFGANILSGVYPTLTRFFLSFQQWMKPVEAMGKTIGEKLGSAVEHVVQVVSNAASIVGPSIGGLVMSIGKTLGAVLPPLWDAFTTVGTRIVGAVSTIANALQKLVPAFGGASDSALNLTNPFDAVIGLADLAAGALGRLTDIINRNPEAVTAMATAVIGAVGAYTTASHAIDAGRTALRNVPDSCRRSGQA